MTPGKDQLDRFSVVVAGSGQVSADLTPDLAGEAVVLDLNGGMYYELNPVGACVWRAIQEPSSVEQLLERVIEVYDVSPEQCEVDVVSLLEKLLALELIEIWHG